MSLIDTPDMNDDDAAIALNNRFELNNKSKFMFAPYALSGKFGTSWDSADARYTSDIMLYDPKTGKRYEEDGKVVRFKIGAEATQAEIDKINEILGYKIKRIKDTGGGGVGSKYNIE